MTILYIIAIGLVYVIFGSFISGTISKFENLSWNETPQPLFMLTLFWPLVLTFLILAGAVWFGYSLGRSVYKIIDKDEK